MGGRTRAHERARSHASECAVLKLYHFTVPENVLLIAASGLRPDACGDRNAHMTAGKPVVWLTRRGENLMTADDMAHFERLGLRHDTKIGEPMFGGPHRLTVNIGSHSKNLQHWATWMRRNSRVFVDENGVALANNAGELFRTDGVLSAVTRDALANWYVYLGT